MTQAFNLSQLANNLNTSGQLDATDGLTGAVPVGNGGTGATVASTARSNLGVGNVGTLSTNGNTGNFLRGDGAWATVPASAPTTAQVLSATAGATLNAIGSYGYAYIGSNTDPGNTTAGSFNWYNTSGGNTGSPSGTWRSMGSMADGSRMTLMVRIS